VTARILAEAVDGVIRPAATTDRERIVQRRITPEAPSIVSGRLRDHTAVWPVDVEAERIQPE
jgi:hypothetical protein